MKLRNIIAIAILVSLKEFFCLFYRVSSTITLNSKFVPFGKTLARRSFEFGRVIIEVPCFRMPDF